MVSELSMEIEISLPAEKPESDGTSDGGEGGVSKKEVISSLILYNFTLLWLVIAKMSRRLILDAFVPRLSGKSFS